MDRDRTFASIRLKEESDDGTETCEETGGVESVASTLVWGDGRAGWVHATGGAWGHGASWHWVAWGSSWARWVWGHAFGYN